MILPAATPQANGIFGNAMINGDPVIAGALGEDGDDSGSLNYSGAVHVFHLE